MNYFELYNIPVSFIIDQQQLKKKFYELSRQYHPDHFSQENSSEQADALEISAQVNKAYKTFQNPDETIKYVLEQKGVLDDSEKYNLPPAFLMEVMELNEQLMEAKMEDDTAQVEQIKVKVKDLQDEMFTEVQPVLAAFDEHKTTEAELLQIKDYYFKKKYLKRILATMQ